MAEPAEKKAKTGETKSGVEIVKPPEPVPELEKDSPAVKGEKVNATILFETADTTLNVMPSSVGGILMALTDGGMNHLLAGARANVGVKKGRYLFEVRIVESRSEGSGWGDKPVCRVGFSTAGSELLLGESGDGVCFEMGGAFRGEGKVTAAGQRYDKDDILGVLLNLEDKHANCGTVSLFKNGVRISPPQALPESLKGKTLFPHVTFRSVSLSVNFGPVPAAPLPFKARMLHDAVAKDVEVTKYPAPKDGRHEVLVPVGLPGEGAYDWLELFLAKNPGYTEISERALHAWIGKSLQGEKRHGIRSSVDKPDMAFGVPELDKGAGLRHIIKVIASLQRRNYVFMEVRGNLLKTERKQILDMFPSGTFNKVAHIIVGDPTAEFKKNTQALVLKQKQEDADKEFKAKQLEEERARIRAKKQREVERAKKKAQKAREKLVAERKRKLEEEAKKKETGATDEKKEEATPVEIEEDEEEEKSEEEPVKEPLAPPKVTLTDEEKKVVFRKQAVPDVVSNVLNTSFSDFSLVADDEGFNGIHYEWSSGAKAREYFKTWVLDRKQTTRVEDIKPSAWFQTKHKEWDHFVTDLHTRHNAYTQLLNKREQQKKQREAKKAAAEAARKKAAENAKEGEETKDEGAMEVEDEKVEETKEIDFKNLDVFGINDINDLGDEGPLCRNFQSEDYTLMGLCFELHMLAHSFKKDVADADRLGIHVDHLPFYYNVYYRKALSPKQYGVDSTAALVALCADSVRLNKAGILCSLLDGEMEAPVVFPKIVEESRRMRRLKLDLGDDTVALRFQRDGGRQGGAGYQPQGGKGGWRQGPYSGGKGGWRQ